MPLTTPLTSSDAVIASAPVPSCMARIPETLAVFKVRSVPYLFVASMPFVTSPVVVIDSRPVPLLKAFMPSVTVVAEMVRSVPWLKALIPVAFNPPAPPLTAPVAVIVNAPELLMPAALIPMPSP